jgi:tetratricopeptide (TPR) repeat protein
MRIHLYWLKFLSTLAELIKNYKYSAKCWVKITNLFPNNFIYYTATANFLALTNKYNMSERFLKKAIKINPHYTPALFNLGFLMQKKNNQLSAIDFFTKSILNDSTLDRAFYGRGISYMKIMDYKNAIKDFNKTIELQPFGPHAYYQLCFIMNEKNNKTEVTNIINKLLKFEPQVANQLKKELQLQ